MGTVDAGCTDMNGPTRSNEARDPHPDHPGGLMDLARAAQRRGDLPEASRNLERAAKLYREARDMRGLVSTALAMGAVSREAGEAGEASGHYRAALALSLDIGWDVGAVRALEGIRTLAMDRGDTIEAELYEGQIRDIRRLLGPDVEPPAG